MTPPSSLAEFLARADARGPTRRCFGGLYVCSPGQRKGKRRNVEAQEPDREPELRAVIACPNVCVERADEEQHEADRGRNANRAKEQSRGQAKCTKGFKCSDWEGQP